MLRVDMAFYIGIVLRPLIKDPCTSDPSIILTMAHIGILVKFRYFP